jgi:flavin reductase (DIM6/NTAB) family NADH-FMN oxidoreductase RutF
MAAQATAETETTALQSFTGKEFRTALGAFATGVTVVTTRGEDHAYGMTANSFSSLSMDPPLVLVCVMSQSEGREVLERNGVFAVNILAHDQEPISNYFASRDRPRGRDAFRQVPHRGELTGSPIIEGVAAFLDCRLHESYEAGDHVILVGEVLLLSVEPEAAPLLFHGGGYRFLRDG